MYSNPLLNPMLNGMGGVNQHNQMRNKPAQNSPRGKKPGGGKKKGGGAFGMGSIENQLMDIIKMQGKTNYITNF